MARVSTCLNFPRSTEPAFNFYRSVFGTEFSAPIMRFGAPRRAPRTPPTMRSQSRGEMERGLPDA